MRTVLMAHLALMALPWVAHSQQETEVRVRLLAPLNTDSNRPGDSIAAEVIAPNHLRGGIMEGEVKQSKSGGKVNGKSVLNFTFKRLVLGPRSIPVSANIQSFVNSKGEQGVDEEGQIIQKKNNLGKAALATGLGALIGAAAGGAKGAAIGAGIGAVASLVVIQAGVKGARVSFAPGSEFVLSVKELRSSAD